ncbi:MAG: DUF2062 domain-containing protein [Proteobacteria bacterium]|nr:DUF2062 domain-containing protein [Pseudomonadota bacterium]
MEKIWNKFARTIRYGYLRVVRIEAPAESIALGLAAGVFAGAMPFLSLQMVIAIGLAFLIRGNPIAAALGTWWTNPFNWAIIFPLLYMLGKVFVPGEVESMSMSNLSNLGLLDLLRQGWKWLLITTLGGFIVGIPLAISTYFVTVRGVRVYHDSRASRKFERRHRELRQRVSPEK